MNDLGSVPTRALVAAGVAFWALVLLGVFTENAAPIGVALALALLTAGVTVRGAMRRSSAGRLERQGLWEGGREAQARVVDITDLGSRVNRHPRVELVLDVSLEDGRRHRASVSVVVATLAVPRVQPGCDIDVRVDPTDPSRLAIDPALTPDL